MFGLMLKSTHDKAVAAMRDANRKQLGVLLEQLEAERRMVATLQGRIARRDTSIATLTADKAAVENELRLEQAKAASKPAAKPAPGKAKAEAPKARRK